MTRELNPMQEQLLEQVVCGVLDEFDPAVQREVAASPEFAAELAELLELANQLDSMAAEDSELPPVGQELEGLVRQTLLPLIEDLPQDSPAEAPSPVDPAEDGQVIRRWPFTTLITAAAALVLGVLGTRFLVGGDPVGPVGPGPTLGSGPGTIELTRDASGAVTGASWSYDEGSDPGFRDFEVILASTEPPFSFTEYVSTASWNFSDAILEALAGAKEVTLTVQPDDPGFAGAAAELSSDFSLE